MFLKFCLSKIITVTLAFLLLSTLGFIARAQDEKKVSEYRIGDSKIEIQKFPNSRTLPLTIKENDKETVVDNVNIVDQYLISNIPEKEFIEKYPYLGAGLKDLRVEIEADQPLFKEENFYKAPSFSDKTKSFFGLKTLPEYRLVKEIDDSPDGIETNFRVPGLSLKTFYKKESIPPGIVSEDQIVKQGHLFENSSQKEINLKLTFTHSLEVSKVFFGGRKYDFLENPQLLSPEIANSVSFSSDGVLGLNYDFSDLLEFNPQIWIFKDGSKNILLVMINFSIKPSSSKFIDPVYTVATGGSSSLQTAYSWQRKTFTDGQYYWAAFWDNGSGNLEFWYSTSGSSWTENTSAKISQVNTRDFTLDCNPSYCFIYYVTSTDIYARKAGAGGGNPYPGNDWSWTDATLVANDMFGTYSGVAAGRSPAGFLCLLAQKASLTNS